LQERGLSATILEIQFHSVKTMVKRGVFLIVLPLWCGAFPDIGYAQSPPAGGKAAPASESPEKIRQKSFDTVWQAVKDDLFDPGIRGVDWVAAKQRYAARIATVKNDDELNELLNEMLSQLHLSHLGVISLKDASKQTSAQGGIGVDVRVIDTQVVIARVEKGSPADKSGLQPGFIVTGVGGESIDQIAGQLSKRDRSPIENRGAVTQRLIKRLQGDPDSAVSLTYLDESKKEQEKKFIRAKRNGEVTQIAGLPPVYFEFEVGQLQGRIGYIRFSSFLPVMKERIRNAIATLKDAPGIVLDLRGNTGGFGDVMNAIAGSFVPEGTVIGVTKTRKRSTEMKAANNGAPYSGPLAILVDEMSRSATEGLAAGLQESARAVIVGETTPGEDLDADVRRLPSGSLFLIPTADERTPKGLAIEGRGVIPDIEVKLTREMLRTGADHQLEAAVKYLRGKAADGKK
jgi:carboxyl-terminal processing protease